eukprot:SAG11_NODE_1988_length_3961_cov_2.373900_5_plen_98_part_00
MVINLAQREDRLRWMRSALSLEGAPSGTTLSFIEACDGRILGRGVHAAVDAPTADCNAPLSSLPPLLTFSHHGYTFREASGWALTARERKAVQVQQP